jgi:hypothetical protein
METTPQQVTDNILKSITKDEIELILSIRGIRPYEEISVKLLDNKLGHIAWTLKSNYRQTYTLANRVP